MLTPNKEPEVIIGMVKRMRFKSTYDLPVSGFFFTAFFQIEAIEPPIRNT